MAYNHCTMMGRLTKDPVLRETQSGKKVGSFSIAVDRAYQNGSEKQTDFFNCTAWGKTGEFIKKYFKKGEMILVDGEIQNRKWEDKEGVERISTEINVRMATFTGSKKESGKAEAGGGVGVQADQSWDEEDVDEDELPF